MISLTQKDHTSKALKRSAPDHKSGAFHPSQPRLLLLFVHETDSVLGRKKMGWGPVDLELHTEVGLPGRIVQGSKQIVAVDDRGKRKRHCMMVDLNLDLLGEVGG